QGVVFVAALVAGGDRPKLGMPDARRRPFATAHPGRPSHRRPGAGGGLLMGVRRTRSGPPRQDGSVILADSSLVDRALLGAIGGVVGTFAMTAAMRAMHRRLPAEQRYPLPPREIVEGGLPEPVKRNVGEQGRRTATRVGHFGYGAVTGAAYALTRRHHGDVIDGALYGASVWAASYLAEMPGLGILKPALRHPAERNLLMIGAHLVWGGTLALAIRELELARREI